MTVSARSLDPRADRATVDAVWPALLDASGSRELGHSPEWFWGNLDALSPPERGLRMVILFREGRPVGMVPIERRPIPIGRFTVPGVGFIRSPIALPHVGLIVTGKSGPVWQAFFTHVFTEVRGWQCFSLEGLDANLVAAPEIRDVLHRRGVVVDRDGWAHWSLRFDGTWHAFLNTRSANFRRNLKRAVGRWEAMGAPVYRRVDSFSLKAIEELDARSWRMAKPQDVQKNTWLLAYCRQLMRIFPDPSAHVIRLLLLDGTPIAGVYGFRWGDALYAYKITYDQAYEACSPGTVLFAKLFEECQQAGIGRIELLGRNHYLERWANERREISRTLVFHRRNLGLAWGWACRAATALKGRRRPDAEVTPP